MAIRVICPGCMTSFEVDDRFAGKRGPCPKCGHIIEIPKEQVIIHAPDVVVDGGKAKKTVGHDARPIAMRRFLYTGKQVFWGIMGSLGALALTFLVGAIGSKLISGIFGAIAVFLVALPICEFGYTLIRDENDLEMFLGNERRIRSLKAAIVFGLSWLVFETLVHFLGTGPVSCVYMLAIGAIGAFGALIFFDCNYGKALLVYFMFMFVAILGRGLLFQWDGWVWETHNRSVAAAPKVDPQRARMNGAIPGQTDEEIVEQRTAIQKEADARRAKAKKAGRGSQEDEGEATPPPARRRRAAPCRGR